MMNGTANMGEKGETNNNKAVLDHRPSSGSVTHSAVSSQYDEMVTIDEQADGDDDEESGQQQQQHRPLLPLNRKADISKSKEMFTCKRLYGMSLWAMRLGVLADSVNNTILRPNYPFMVSPDYPGSFPTTAPFGFVSAQYFIPMTNLLGTAIAAIFVGSWSDRYGRRPVMLVQVAFGFVGSIAKYFARTNFYAFCGVNLVTGFFGATLPVSMAYASDVAQTRSEKDAVIGSLVAISMLGGTGGGIVSIAMARTGLFTPLLVSGSMCALAALYGYFFLIEPDRIVFHRGRETKLEDDEDGEESTGTGPKTIDWRVCSNILAGSILDNAGSVGFIPFCLSPLAFNTFLGQFLERRQLPLMSAEAFRWLSTLLALMIVPSAAFSNRIFAKVGAAAACVVGNTLTAVATILLLQIATAFTPTTATYGVFFAVMYCAFPLTVISQLSTGPMLDRIAPSNRRGFVQGLNSSVMQFGMAIFPWVFGLSSDAIGVTTTIWICIGTSFMAAIVNAPLMWVKALKPKRKKPEYSRAIDLDENDVVDAILAGKWVPPEKRWDVNQKRMRSGHSFLVTDYGKYEDDKKGENLCALKRHSREDFEFYSRLMKGYLESDCLETENSRANVADMIHRARAPVRKRTQLKRELGEWFGDYMEDSGYQIDESPFIMKQLIMSAFPRVMKPGDKEITADNIEQVTLNFARIYRHYLEGEENAAYLTAFAQAYMA